MINHSKGLDLEITDLEYHDYPTPSGEIIPSQTSKYIVLFYETEQVKKGDARRAEQLYKREGSELKANEPVSEQSERANVDIGG